MQGVHLRKYGVQTTINFELYEIDGIDFKVDAAHAAGDTTIMKDEGAEASTTNAFTDEGQGYSIVLTATEMQAARIVVYIVDQGTKAWLDKAVVIETYGNASAMHAVDLSDSVRAGLTALPNAAADAAGGLPISDAGGLDIDAKLANTNEVTAARMGALTDWINGGRLDLLLDAIKAVTDLLPNAGALSSLAQDATVAKAATVATAAAQATAQADLDLITGADGAIIASGTQTFNMTGSITGSLSGSVGSVSGAVGSVTGAVGSVTGNVGGNVAGSVGSVTGHTAQTGDTYALANGANGFVATKADTAAILLDTGTDGVVVAAASKTGFRLSATGVDDVLDEALTELAAVPAAAPSLRAAMQFLFQALRNRTTTTASEQTIQNDAGTVIATAALSDDATTFTKGEFA